MADRPNFLIFMSDEHAPGCLGAYGHPVVRTPVLDRLCRESVSFSQAYAAYPMCTPARMSFMTGHYTPEHRVWELGDPLDAALPTWAHALRHAGYDTALAGRMHFIGAEQLHGFARRLHPDVPEYAGYPPAYAYGDWDGDRRQRVMLEPVAAAGPADGDTPYQQYDRVVCDAAIRELHAIASREDRQPWALAVGLIHPHFPFRVSDPWYNCYHDADIPLPATPPEGRAFDGCIPEIFRGIRRWSGLSSDGLSDDRVREARRCYYGMVSFMDAQIGRVLEAFERLGLAGDTYVVYLSDHGESLGEHGLWAKMTFYEDSIRIPWMIRCPDGRGAGSVCPAPVSQVDWLPTVLELAGDAPWLEALPGRSLAPLLADPAETWPDRVVLADYACAGVAAPLRMVRRGRWKACFGDGVPPALFDLQADPHEWDDRAREAGCQPLLDELLAVARADGWDSATLRPAVLTHQRRLRYIADAHAQPRGT